MKGMTILVGAISCLLNVSAYSSQRTTEIEQIQITKDDLILTDNGIYFIEDGEITEVSAIYSNANGIIVVPNRDLQKGGIVSTCGNGHDIYHHYHDGGCGGCANWWCVFRCKCNSPWAES